MTSVRFRLLILALAPMVLLMPLLLFLGMTRWTADYDEVLIANVESDLRIAEQYLSRLMVQTEEELQAVAGSVEFARTPRPGFEAFFEEKRAQLELDFLYYLPRGEATGTWPVIESAAQGQGRTEIDIFSGAALSAISPDLASRARLPLIETEAAVPTDREVEDRGMIIHSATPVRLPGRDGVLVGGILLNRNLGFIDTINALVYQDAVAGGSRQGTATLFLEDVRVSTNVRLFEDVRALGTRVSAAVRGQVLGEGQTWLDRAFVVNDWYISGYLPLRDSFGDYVGMLYVGVLEQPFTTAKRNAFLAILAAFVAVLLLSAPVFLRLAKGIFAPLERMIRTMVQVQRGNMSARNGQVGASGEIEEVAGHLDDLLDQIQERDQRLRSWNEQLNERVDKRTAELQRANEKLEETFRQLVMSEKLASIGEITAGVAHEINNPVAVIQGNMDVIRESLGDSSETIRTELGLVDRQIARIQTIVGKLLQFARPGEFADLDQTVPVSPVITDCLVLVNHVISHGDIRVETHLHAEVAVRIDPGELQQVLINLIMNAVQAMEERGVLTLTSAGAERDGVAGVRITVSDTGPGIAPEDVDDVFAPFYTTKQAEGTGLGLSISQTLIQRAGGLITAHNQPDGGARFEVWLPAATIKPTPLQQAV
ncbi:cache domain-containing protein [Ruegeria sp. 2205SS24-7]|uniref:sensor histidine kinase n=1 Tax=Ruegeria discodermiae TaxID=3064389 RepID=UPI002740E7CC|nr:cache domain-containing protein [Ruegeria sp. 2205SS24-7]MDP5219078.1 cache domain-containing protein [Ruegeria sp. 2205SS24-7]